MADRVADRALERDGVELLLDQVVGDAERGRLEVDLVVALAGEHDHRRERTGGEPFADQLEPGARAEAVVDQVDVVARSRIAARPSSKSGTSRARTARRSWRGEHVAGDQVVVLVVLDEEDRDRLSGRGGHRPSPLGSSTISNQYRVQVRITSTSPANVTGLVMNELTPRS